MDINCGDVLDGVSLEKGPGNLREMLKVASGERTNRSSGYGDNEFVPWQIGAVMSMAFETILVSLNELDRLDALLSMASALARDNGAQVTGVYVVPSPAVYPAVGPYVIPEVYDGLTRHFRGGSNR